MRVRDLAHVFALHVVVFEGLLSFYISYYFYKKRVF